MSTTNQINPGMTINLNGKIYRVESSVKVTVVKGTPFIKTKLRDLLTDKLIEKNFKTTQTVEEVSLKEYALEFLYPEGKDYLFLNIETLEQVLVPSGILGDKINYLKEGTQVKASFYGEAVFTIELPEFLELMVVKTPAVDEKMNVAHTTKEAVLETGAKIKVPLFIEVGDVLKVDTYKNEFIQRI